MSGTTPQPGWYPDPAQPGQARYWTGSSWSDQTQAIPSAAAAAPEPAPVAPATPETPAEPAAPAEPQPAAQAATIMPQAASTPSSVYPAAATSAAATAVAPFSAAPGKVTGVAGVNLRSRATRVAAIFNSLTWLAIIVGGIGVVGLVIAGLLELFSGNADAGSIALSLLFAALVTAFYTAVTWAALSLAVIVAAYIAEKSNEAALDQ